MKKNLFSIKILALFLLSLVSTLSLTGCASQANSPAKMPTVPKKIPKQNLNYDPYEKYNRFMYHVNDELDKDIMKPTATFYYKVMPRPLYKGMHNVFTNLESVPTLANDLMQANFYQANSDTWRLAVNSTIGIAGLFDVASSMGLEANQETFGLTMAKWGWQNSNYFILPFFGPNTVRGSIGEGVDWFLSVYPFIPDVAVRNTFYVLSKVDERAQLLQYQGVFDNASLDPYVFMRNAYMQREQYLLERNRELNDPYTAKETQEYAESDSYFDAE